MPSIENILDYAFLNDSFLIRMISIHYRFTKENIIKYNKILKWGSGVNTWNERDPFYQQASFAIYGLYLNQHIDWKDKEILDASHFEANSYQWTGYDPDSLPLSIKDEIEAMMPFLEFNLDFTNWSHLLEITDINGLELPENQIDQQIDILYKEFEIEKHKTEILIASIDDNYSFNNFIDFVNFIKTAHPILGLNNSLFNNYITLLNENRLNIIKDILEVIFEHFNQNIE